MGLNLGVAITWLGHSTFLLRSASGKRILLEGWVDTNPRCPERLKGLAECDVMVLSHAHSDHAGDAVAIAKRTGARVVAIYELAGLLQARGVQNTVPMNIGGSVDVDGVGVTLVRAFHSSSMADGDRPIYAGEAAGYVVRLENGLAIYHAGDTTLYGDMALIGELYHPALALVPIGDTFTMGPEEAARAVRLVGAQHAVPMHYGTFPALTGTPERFRAALAETPAVRVHVMEPGETLE